MSIFGTILEKLGLHKPAPQSAPPSSFVNTGVPKNPMPGASTSTPAAKPPPATGIPAPAAASTVSAPKPAPMALVDVVSKLDKMASGSPGLDWKVSIVDLLKLLGIDSSLSARKELATELGCPADLMTGDYAKMNVWLHKAVLQKIAENGGNIPQSLLD